MKTLYIVRHAKSSWKHDSLDDMYRPLKKRGYQDALAMSERLAARQVKPGLLITSPAIRAYSTALIMATQFEYDPAAIWIEPSFYQGGSEAVLTRLSELRNNTEQVMIFGHEPIWSELAGHLSGERVESFPTCSVAAINLEIERWEDIHLARGRKLFVISPEKAQVPD